jgi:hypothetical protein
MIVDPSSRSLFLRATRILVVRVESSAPGPWAPRKPTGEERVVALSLKLEEIPRGQVTQRPGETLHLDARQVRMGFAWGPMPGVWSNASIDPGAHLVAFGRSDQDDAAASLGDPGAIQILPAEEVLADVHLAAQAESSHLDLAGLLAQAKAVAPSLGFLFADYLWARDGAEAMADLGKLDAVAALLEDPRLGDGARTTLVMTLSTAVAAPEPPALKHVDRFALALFRLLAMPQTAALHDNLVGTYLPDTLGLAHPQHRSATEVFHDHPGERARAVAAVRAYRGAEPVAPLLAWLEH